METLPSFKKVMAMGKNSVITIRMELKSDKQVKTFWAVKMWSVKTYVKKVTKVISTVELKKNDKNAPRTKASFRNQESSDLKTKKQTIYGIAQFATYIILMSIRVRSRQPIVETLS